VLDSNTTVPVTVAPAASIIISPPISWPSTVIDCIANSGLATRRPPERATTR